MVIHIEEQTQTTPKKGNTAKLAIIAVVVVLLIVISVIGFNTMNSKKTTEDVTTNGTPNTNEANGTETPNTSAYKNGTYTQVGEYVSPGGPETVSVTLTFTDGVISDAVVTPQAVRPISKEKQADFTANFKPFVIGKNIDEVMLTKVSGSSLTPKGFNDALDKIKAEAQS